MEKERSQNGLFQTEYEVGIYAKAPCNMKEIIWESCTTILVWRVYLEIRARNQHCGAINVNLYSLTCLKDNKKLLYNSEFNINTQIIPSFCAEYLLGDFGELYCEE